MQIIFVLTLTAEYDILSVSGCCKSPEVCRCVMKDHSVFSISDICEVALFTALVSVLAQISIPLPGGVPLTMQTMAVLMTGIVLGSRRGCGVMRLPAAWRARRACIFQFRGRTFETCRSYGRLFTFVPSDGLDHGCLCGAWRRKAPSGRPCCCDPDQLLHGYIHVLLFDRKQHRSFPCSLRASVYRYGYSEGGAGRLDGFHFKKGFEPGRTAGESGIGLSSEISEDRHASVSGLSAICVRSNRADIVNIL